MDAAHRILVVDDNPTNTLLLDRALRKAGYDVLVAADGFEAVDLATQHRPSLVLLDLMMPGRDGLETCKILKAKEATAAIPVIFVTAVSDSASLVNALGVGGCDYVIKPFKIKEVLARVSVHVRLKEAEDDLSNSHAQLERLANQLAAVNEELGRQARVDPLTKLLNRRAWEESSVMEDRRSERLTSTYGIVMIDLDHFKALNDTQGHAAGDDCLSQVAECIASTCRRIDLVGRYGGEEFIILCPETDATGVMRSAQRLRSAISELAIHHTSVAAVSRMTASLGVAINHGRSLEATIKEADDALYVAKASGRNRVCWADSPPPTKSDRPDEANLSTPAEPVREGSGDQPVVLIVDKDPATALACRRGLAADGFQIQEALSPHDLMSQVRSIAPDVILMDSMTPTLGGLACAKQLKSDPRTQGIPIILVSSRADDETVNAGLEAGAEEYLVKPIRTAELVLRIRSMVRLRRKQDELVQSYRLRGEQTLFLSTLLDLCQSLGIETEMDTAFARVMETTAELATSRCVSIMMPDTTGEYLTIASSIGMDPETEASIRVSVDDGVAGQVFRTGEAVVVNAESVESAPRDVIHAPSFASVPLACSPVGFGGEILGVLIVSDRLCKKPFEPQELEYINLLASLAGSTIHGILSLRQREQARDAIMLALARLAEHRDNETGRHVERVTRYCLILAEQLRTTDEFHNRINGEFLSNLTRAAPLHDIGKVAIPDMILLKPGKLTTEEIEVMRSHARVGADTIETAIRHAPGSAFLEMARQIAGCHHEWYDGSGYPAGLRGNAIPLAARVAAVADVYDALTSQRPYKEALSHEESSASIIKLSGTQFDPAVIEAFVQRKAEFAALALELSDEGVLAPADQGHERCSEPSHIGAV